MRREFTVLCRRWQLFTEATVAIDGSKFKAVNHRDRNFTIGKTKTRMAPIADRGCYSSEQIKACNDAGIAPAVPKPITSNSSAGGRYEKWDFTYSPKRDAYRCPAGEYAIQRFTSVENGLAIHKYWSSGTIKSWMGATRLLVSALTDGKRRDEPARTGLQPEASDENHGNRNLDRGAARLIGVGLAAGSMAGRPRDSLDQRLRGELSHSLGQQRTLTLCRTWPYNRAI